MDNISGGNSDVTINDSLETEVFQVLTHVFVFLVFRDGYEIVLEIFLELTCHEVEVGFGDLLWDADLGEDFRNLVFVTVFPVAEFD